MAPTPPRFQVEQLVQADGSPHLRVHGELDVVTAPLLQERLRDACRGHRPVRLDLSQVAFIDSTGLHAVLGGVREARSEHVTVVIDPVVSDAVAAVLALTDAARLLWPDGRTPEGGPDADRVLGHRLAYPSVREVPGARLAGPTAHPATDGARPARSPRRPDRARR